MLAALRHVLVFILPIVAAGALSAILPVADIPHWGIDLYTFRSASKAMKEGADIYEPSTILTFAGGATVGDIHDYVYAPFFAFALRPLAALSPETASRVWLAGNLVLLMASIGLSLSALDWHPSTRVFALVASSIAVFPPTRTTLIIGQSTILLLFFFATSLWFCRLGKPLIGGLFFAMGLFKPHLLPIAVFFLLHEHWAWLVGLVSGMLLLQLPFVGWIEKWFRATIVTHQANLAGDQCFQMVSLASLLDCLTDWPTWTAKLLLPLIGFAFLEGVYRITASPTDPASQREKRNWHLALWIVASTLLLDHTRVADQMLLLFPVLVIARNWHALRKPWARRLGVGLVAFAYMLPYFVDAQSSRAIVLGLPFWYIGISLAALSLLLLESVLAT